MEGMIKCGTEHAKVPMLMIWSSGYLGSWLLLGVNGATDNNNSLQLVKSSWLVITGISLAGTEAPPSFVPAPLISVTPRHCWRILVIVFSSTVVSTGLAILGLASLPLQAYSNPLPRDTFSTLTTSQITTFRPYSHYASTGYCKPAKTLAWNCGANCNANPAFKPVASGGDGAIVQYWFVGYDTTLKTVIVSHQGTVAEKILPVITDANFNLRSLKTSLFPGVASGVKVHDGFADSQERSAKSVLAAVQTAISKSGYSQVTLVGHSLGAALSLLDGVYLKLALPSINFRVVGYGMPRVGNEAFATLAVSKVSIDRVNNLEDLVPILPGRFLGFQHTTGEKRIQPNGQWVSCPGNDNTDERCTTGAVKNIFVGNFDDHSGPYDTVTMGC